MLLMCEVWTRFWRVGWWVARLVLSLFSVRGEWREITLPCALTTAGRVRESSIDRVVVILVVKMSYYLFVRVGQLSGPQASALQRDVSGVIDRHGCTDVT